MAREFGFLFFGHANSQKNDTVVDFPLRWSSPKAGSLKQALTRARPEWKNRGWCYDGKGEKNMSAGIGRVRWWRRKKKGRRV